MALFLAVVVWCTATAVLGDSGWRLFAAVLGSIVAGLFCGLRGRYMEGGK